MAKIYSSQSAIISMWKSNKNISQSKTTNDEDKPSSASFVSEIASSPAKLKMIDLRDSTFDKDNPMLPSEKDELMESALEEKDHSLSKNEMKEKRLFHPKNVTNKILLWLQ